MPAGGRARRRRSVSVVKIERELVESVSRQAYPATSRRTPHASSLTHDKRRPLIPTPVFPFRRRQFPRRARSDTRRRSKIERRTPPMTVFLRTKNRYDFPHSRPCEHAYTRVSSRNSNADLKCPTF